MTNLATQLAQIQLMGAGVYQLVDDTNTNLPPVVSNARLRLIPINVKKGPFNNLILFQQRDIQGFTNVFGDITRKDERQGNFSIRTCRQALENGPILVINLRKFDQDVDLTQFQGLTTMLTSQLADQNNAAPVDIAFSKLFSTDRLWTTKPDALLGVADSNLLSIANIGSKNLSVFIRKSQNQGYRQKISTYYQNQNRPVPEYLNPNDLMVESMVEVFVFNTDFSDAVKNMASETYGQFFDQNGLVQNYVTQTGTFDALQLLTTVTEAGFVQSFEGSLIPGSLDSNKNPFYIEEVVNASALITGLLVKVDDVKFENYSDFEPELDENDLPIYEDNASKRIYPIDLIGQDLFSIGVSGAVDETKLTPTIKTLSYNGYTLTKGEITKVGTGENIDYDLSQFNRDVLKVPVYTDAANFTNDQSTLIIPDVVSVNIGDKYISVSGNLVRIFELSQYGSRQVIVGLGTPGVALQANGTEFPKNPQGLYIYPVGNANVGELVVFNGGGLPMTAPTGGTAIPVPTLTDQQFAVLFTKYGKLINYLKVKFDGFVENGYNTPSTTDLEVTVDGETVELKESRAFLLRSATNNASLSAFKLKPYKVRPNQFTNGTNENQKDVLSVLGNPGIVAGLKATQASEILKFRYVIDAFKTYIEPNAKSELAAIANATNSRAIANMPFMSDFSASTNPYFKDSPIAEFDTRYIPLGGNKNIPSNNTFSLPKDYASDIWFFGPGLKANHYGTTVIVPPSGGVSKAFINKFTGGQPYDTVANTTGLFSIDAVSGVEYPITKEEAGALERFGYNPIIDDPNLGLKIYGDYTAKNDVQSDLSKIHISELVLTIQEEFEAILRPMPFKANNAANRLQLKTAADVIMQRIQDNGGVVWFLNICDENNNTQDLINRDMGIIETHIQATRNGEKWVHVLTLHNGLPSFAVQ